LILVARGTCGFYRFDLLSSFSTLKGKAAALRINRAATSINRGTDQLPFNRQRHVRQRYRVDRAAEILIFPSHGSALIIAAYRAVHVVLNNGLAITITPG